MARPNPGAPVMRGDDIYSRVHSATPLPLPLHLVLLLFLLVLQLLAPSAATPVNPCPHKGMAELIRNSPVIVKALVARIFADEPEGPVQSLAQDTILITLTPETIYKGASLLKVANGNTDAGNPMSPRVGGLMSWSSGPQNRGEVR